MNLNGGWRSSVIEFKRNGFADEGVLFLEEMGMSSEIDGFSWYMYRLLDIGFLLDIVILDKEVGFGRIDRVFAVVLVK